MKALNAILVFTLVIGAFGADVLNPEVQALCDIKTILNPFSWQENIHSPCDMQKPCEYAFPGVVCDATKEHVITLNLFTEGMKGDVPQSIINLTHIQTLVMKENRITGDLPDLSVMTELHTLDFSNTLINGGAIPDWVCRLTKLRHFGFSESSRTGTIPDCLFSNEMISIGLAGNKFSGDVTKFLTLQNIQSLDLSNNAEIVEISPAAICSATALNLKHLYMSNTNLKGEMNDCETCLLTNLVELDISQNRLTGNLPVNFFNTRKLTLLNVGSNEFSGTVTDESFSFKDIDLSYNKLECNTKEWSCAEGQNYSGYSPKYSGSNNAIIITFCIISAVAFCAITGFFVWREYRKPKVVYQSI